MHPKTKHYGPAGNRLIPARLSSPAAQTDSGLGVYFHTYHTDVDGRSTSWIHAKHVWEAEDDERSRGCGASAVLVGEGMGQCRWAAMAEWSSRTCWPQASSQVRNHTPVSPSPCAYFILSLWDTTWGTWENFLKDRDHHTVEKIKGFLCFCLPALLMLCFQRSFFFPLFALNSLSCLVISAC